MAVTPATGWFFQVAAATTGGTAPGLSTAPTGCALSSPVDLSSWVTAIDAGPEYEELDVTTFGSGGFKAFAAGLVMGTASISFLQDYAASAPNAVLGLGGTLAPGNTTYYGEIRPTSGARSTTNPAFVFAFKNRGIRTFNASVGQIPTFTFTPSVTGGFGQLVA
jgi:hypothetical protein